MPKRTYADRADYLKVAVAKRRRKIKELLVEYKGGKCIICGYNRYFGAFDLHHTGDSPKTFGLSMNGITRSWKKQKLKQTSASFFAQIAIEKSTAALRSFHEEILVENKVNCWKPDRTKKFEG